LLQTLFYIPHEIAGLPVFGWGWVLGLIILGGVGLLFWQARQPGSSPGEALGYVPVLLLLAAAVVFLIPRLEVVETLPDESEHVLGVPIRGYGVMMLLGVVSGVGLAAHRARRMGLDPEIIFSLAFWTFLAGISGARLFFIIEYWEQFQRPTVGETLGALLNVTQGGLVFYGSMIGGMLAAAIFVAVRKLPGLALFDLVAPSLMIGLAFGRIGCLLNGCCYGGVCELPWAVEFPTTSPAYAHQLQQGMLWGFRLSADENQRPVVVEVTKGSQAEKSGLPRGARISAINGKNLLGEASSEGTLRQARPRTAYEAAQQALLTRGAITLTTAQGEVIRLSQQRPTHTLPVHPTQIYSSINAALLCLFLLAVYRFRWKDGVTTATLLTIYPVTRFVLEAIRNDEPAIFGTGFTISQNVSLLMLAGAVLLWGYVLWIQKRGTAWPVEEDAQTASE